MLFQKSTAIVLEESELRISPDGLLQFIVCSEIAVKVINGYFRLSIILIVFLCFCAVADHQSRKQQ